VYLLCIVMIEIGANKFYFYLFAVVADAKKKTVNVATTGPLVTKTQ
jgi:hypothetical protein